MRHPVQVNTEHTTFQARQILLYVEVFLVQHHRRQVVNTRAEAVAFEVLAQRGESQRVHFENRCRRHHVRHGAVHNRALAKIVRRGRVYESEV